MKSNKIFTTLALCAAVLGACVLTDSHNIGMGKYIHFLREDGETIREEMSVAGCSSYTKRANYAIQDSAQLKNKRRCSNNSVDSTLPYKRIVQEKFAQGDL